MNHRDATGIMTAAMPVFRDYVVKAVQPIIDRLVALEKRVQSEVASVRKDVDALRPDVEKIGAAIGEEIADNVAKAFVEMQEKVNLAIIRDVEAEVAKRQVDAASIAAVVAEEVAKIPAAPAGKDSDPAEVAKLLVDLMPVPADGKSVTVDDVRPLLEEMVAALPKPKDGKDIDPEVVRAMVVDEVAKNKPADGRDGDPGKDGVSVTLEDVKPIIDEAVKAAVAEIPPAAPGKDADPEFMKAAVAEEVARAVAELPKPENGKDADPAVIAEMVKAAVAEIPRAKDGKDGIGVAGALIDRDGVLVLTLSDGTTKDLGSVVGRDADMAAIEARIKSLFDAVPRPKDGLDGVGFDDLDVTHDGERKITLRFSRGENVKEFSFDLPVVIDRGVWREQAYSKGDGVTWGGQFYIAQRNTEATEKPLDGSSSWRLSIKKGRDGRDGRNGVDGKNGAPGAPGRDGKSWA